MQPVELAVPSSSDSLPLSRQQSAVPTGASLSAGLVNAGTAVQPTALWQDEPRIAAPAGRGIYLHAPREGVNECESRAIVSGG